MMTTLKDFGVAMLAAWWVLCGTALVVGLLPPSAAHICGWRRPISFVLPTLELGCWLVRPFDQEETP
jgi:hypothetical protein